MIPDSAAQSEGHLTHSFSFARLSCPPIQAPMYQTPQPRHYAPPSRIRCRSGWAREIASKISVQVSSIRSSSFARSPTLGRCQFRALKPVSILSRQRGDSREQDIVMPEPPMALGAKSRRADQRTSTLLSGTRESRLKEETRNM